jgi:hypothetical protein
VEYVFKVIVTGTASLAVMGVVAVIRLFQNSRENTRELKVLKAAHSACRKDEQGKLDKIDEKLGKLFDAQAIVAKEIGEISGYIRGASHG